MREDTTIRARHPQLKLENDKPLSILWSLVSRPKIVKCNLKKAQTHVRYSRCRNGCCYGLKFSLTNHANSYTVTIYHNHTITQLPPHQLPLLIHLCIRSRAHARASDKRWSIFVSFLRRPCKRAIRLIVILLVRSVS